jgi:hypothetical protein
MVGAEGTRVSDETGTRLADCGRGDSVVGLVLVDQDGTIADFERALLDAFRAKHPDAPFIDVPDRREVSARKQYGPEWGPAVDAIMKTEGFYLSLPVITGVPRAFDEMLEAGLNARTYSSWTDDRLAGRRAGSGSGTEQLGGQFSSK